MIIKNNGIDPYKNVSMENIEKNSRANATQKGSAVANPLGDKVSFSDDARLRTQAYSAAMNSPDVRGEKVSKLKEDVASGNYTPNSAKTAKAMVNDMVSHKAMYKS